MLPEEFDQRVRHLMTERPHWFSEVKPVACNGDVETAEARLGCSLPGQFKHFARTFGGGYFGFANLSTLRENSDWYLFSHPPVEVDGKPMLVVTDDQTGGYYGFLLVDGTSEPSVTYVHPNDGNYQVKATACFFDFVDKYALRVAGQ